MKDAVATMGEILTDDVGGRDAVHVAVISAVAGGNLAPGQHVGFLIGAPETPYTGTDPVVVLASKEPIGIVDPFLKTFVMSGQRFWLYLYPRTITSLRHNWTHPAFSDAKPGETYARPTERAESEAWLRDFATRSDCPDYDTLIAAAAGDHEKNRNPGDDPADYPGYYNSSNDGEFLHFGGRDAHGEIPDEFWRHVEIVTGRKATNRAKYFSCSC